MGFVESFVWFFATSSKIYIVLRSYFDIYLSFWRMLFWEMFAIKLNFKFLKFLGDKTNPPQKFICPQHFTYSGKKRIFESWQDSKNASKQNLLKFIVLYSILTLWHEYFICVVIGSRICNLIIIYLGILSSFRLMILIM